MSYHSASGNQSRSRDASLLARCTIKATPALLAKMDPETAEPLAMPIRPAPWVSWVSEAEALDVSPPGVLRHALVLVGGATTLYTRQMPCTLRAPLCRLQELPLYADASSFGEVADDTQLVVFKNCSISDVWRDRDVIRARLDEMNIVFLCADPRSDDGQAARLARRLGMDASTARPFYLVTNRDLQEAAERAEEEGERAAEVVEASLARDLDALRGATWHQAGIARPARSGSAEAARDRTVKWYIWLFANCSKGRSPARRSAHRASTDRAASLPPPPCGGGRQTRL